MDSSPWYFSGPTSSQTLILCPRWLQWCDPGTGPGYRPGKWTPNHKITSEFVKFFSELKYLLFSFPCQFFWSVNMFRFSKSIVKSWLGASHVRSFDAVWNVWRLDACPLSELSPAQAPVRDQRSGWRLKARDFWNIYYFLGIIYFDDYDSSIVSSDCSEKTEVHW